MPITFVFVVIRAERDQWGKKGINSIAKGVYMY